MADEISTWDGTVDPGANDPYTGPTVFNDYTPTYNDLTTTGSYGSVVDPNYNFTISPNWSPQNNIQYEPSGGGYVTDSSGVSWSGLGSAALKFLTDNWRSIASAAGGIAAFMQANGAKKVSGAQSVADQYAAYRKALHTPVKINGKMVDLYGPMEGIKPMDRMRVKQNATTGNWDFIPPANAKADGGLVGYADGGLVGFAKGGLAEKNVRKIVTNLLGRAPTADELAEYTKTTTNNNGKTVAAYTTKSLTDAVKAQSLWGATPTGANNYTFGVAAGKGWTGLVKDSAAKATLANQYLLDQVKYSGYRGAVDANGKPVDAADFTAYYDKFKAYRPEVAAYLADQYAQSLGGVTSTGLTKAQQKEYDAALAAAWGYQGKPSGKLWESYKASHANDVGIQDKVKALDALWNQVMGSWDMSNISPYTAGHVDEFPKDGLWDDTGKPVVWGAVDPTKTVQSDVDNGNGTRTITYTDGTSEVVGTPQLDASGKPVLGAGDRGLGTEGTAPPPKTPVGEPVDNGDGTKTQYYSDRSTVVTGTKRTLSHTVANADGSMTDWYTDGTSKVRASTAGSAVPSSSPASNVYTGDVTKYGQAGSGGEHQWFNISNPLPAWNGSPYDPSVIGANQPKDPWHDTTGYMPTPPKTTTNLGNAIISQIGWDPTAPAPGTPVQGWDPKTYVPPAINYSLVDPNAKTPGYASGGKVKKLKGYYNPKDVSGLDKGIDNLVWGYGSHPSTWLNNVSEADSEYARDMLFNLALQRKLDPFSTIMENFDTSNKYANGGPVWQTYNDGIIPGAPQTYERGGHVQGPGTGQSDSINAKLSDGEYVIDADTVAALGDGSTKAGASALDQMRMEIRKHKRSAPAHKIPPKAKPAIEYLKKSKRGAKK